MERADKPALRRFILTFFRNSFRSWEGRIESDLPVVRLLKVGTKSVFVHFKTDKDFPLSGQQRVFHECGIAHIRIAGHIIPDR